MTEGKKVIYDGVRLFTTEGLTRFNGDFDLAFAYLWKRAFRVAQRSDSTANSRTATCWCRDRRGWGRAECCDKHPPVSVPGSRDRTHRRAHANRTMIG